MRNKIVKEVRAEVKVERIRRLVGENIAGPYIGLSPRTLRKALRTIALPNGIP